jgi:secondary thiamine-phosphate synthase enzyme
MGIRMVLHEQLPIRTHKRCHWIDITEGIQDIISRSGLDRGMVFACSLHTTAGLTINENADPDVETDFFSTLARIVPHQGPYRHSEGNSDSHLKASLVGLGVQIPFGGARLVRGTWQSIYLCEFDGPRDRRVSVTVIGEQDHA